MAEGAGVLQHAHFTALAWHHGDGVGDVEDVVFPCSRIAGDDGDTLRICYGAGDTYVCLATASIRELLDWLRHHDSPGTG